MTTRRHFVFVLGCAGLMTGLPAFSQRQNKVWRVGFLSFGSRHSAVDIRRYDEFRRGMRDLGYVEGRDLVIEALFAQNKVESVAGLAAQLVRENVEVIVTGGTIANSAAQQATKTIPIVIAHSPDPVSDGLAASLARPGGNITGLSSRSADLDAKHAELLKAALPRMSRLGVLMNPNNRRHQSRAKSVQTAAQKLGATVVVVNARSLEDVDRAFAAMAQEKADAAVLLTDILFVGNAREVAASALKHRLPSILAVQEYPEGGGLMSFGPDTTANYHRAAVYVDKIFKGAKPGELPIEQPAKFELTVNLKTARALGLALPERFLMRADRVIQ